MTLDEAIAHCLEVAEKNEISAITYKNCKKIKTNMYEKLTAEKAENDCRECAADHRQLAEWLIELKKAKRFIREIENKLYLGTSFYPSSFLKENEKLFDELTKGVEYLDT